MSDFSCKPETAWRCGKCGGVLVLKTVSVEYLGSMFAVDLPTCEACGLALVPEDLATGKMFEVEQLLEDK